MNIRRETVALVPLRGGSKSIPLKNIKNIAGKPLCAWVLEAACDALGGANVFVSTESPEIANVVNNLHLGVHIIERPDELATDSASTESVMLHFAQTIAFDTLITLQATSPLTTAHDIHMALNKYTVNNYDSMVTGVHSIRFFWTPDGKAINYDPLNRPRRQEVDGWIMENGAFYITGHDVLQRYKCRLGGKIGVYEMPPETAIEIDDMQDWIMVEHLLISRRRSTLHERLRKIKLLAVDVDGTLTDAGMYYSAAGEELKKFNTRDAQGLALVRESGIDIAIITKENSPIVTARARKLNINNCFIGIEDKVACLNGLCKTLGISIENVLYIGDDVSDVECLKLVGLAACPSDAVDTIRKVSHYICTNPGGSGAVREVCELLIS